MYIFGPEKELSVESFCIPLFLFRLVGRQFSKSASNINEFACLKGVLWKREKFDL